MSYAGLFDQLRYSYEFVALGSELIDYYRQRLMSLLARITRVHDDDIPWMRFRNDTADDFIDTYIHPVERVCIPLNHFVVELIGNFQHPFVKIAIRQPNQAGSFSGNLG